MTTIRRAGSAVLNFLLPQAKAQACTDGWCETSSQGGRCCKQCTGGKVCTRWGFGCPNGCSNY